PLRQDEDHQNRLEHFLKALLGPLSRSRAVLLITNQVREKIGVLYGSPETNPWHTRPLWNFASQRVNVSRTGNIKEGEDVVGIETRAKLIKNRFAGSLAQVTVPLHFALGIGKEAELLSLGLESGLVTKRGLRLSFDGSLLGAGQNEAVQSLRQDA